jgi:hypothetical protein
MFSIDCRLVNALYQCLLVRVPIVLVMVIFELKHNKLLVILTTGTLFCSRLFNILFDFFSTSFFFYHLVAAMVFLVNAFLSLVIFYHSIMTSSTNISATSKIVMLKVCVGLIVVQGIIVQIITMADATGR